MAICPVSRATLTGHNAHHSGTQSVKWSYYARSMVARRFNYCVRDCPDRARARVVLIHTIFYTN